MGKRNKTRPEILRKWVEREFSPKYVERVFQELLDVATGTREGNKVEEEQSDDPSEIVDSDPVVARISYGNGLDVTAEDFREVGSMASVAVRMVMIKPHDATMVAQIIDDLRRALDDANHTGDQLKRQLLEQTRRLEEAQAALAHLRRLHEES